ncbi:hypothetical protein C2E23DRAFT_591626 [Lenzites betulinus]|nr:hypothetical protein C2E23DRAFT_591626 [Lenzites betulinus]
MLMLVFVFPLQRISTTNYPLRQLAPTMRYAIRGPAGHGVLITRRPATAHPRRLQVHIAARPVHRLHTPKHPLASQVISC